MSAKENKKPAFRRAISIVLVSLLVAGFIRLFVFASFRMPSGQMENTILAGEWIGVNQLAYGVRLPEIEGNTIRRTYFCNRPVHKNDVLLYRHEGHVMIARCIGLPGDTIETKGFDYYINGKEVLQLPNIVLPYQYRMENDSLVSDQMRRQSLALRDSLTEGAYKVRYLNRYEHYALVDALPDSISLVPYSKEQKDYRIGIPKEAYWVLCDNINASADSRHFGFVRHEDLIGKANFVWFSKDPKQSLLKGYRFNRMFTPVF